MEVTTCHCFSCLLLVPLFSLDLPTDSSPTEIIAEFALIKDFCCNQSYKLKKSSCLFLPLFELLLFPVFLLL